MHYSPTLHANEPKMYEYFLLNIYLFIYFFLMALNESPNFWRSELKSTPNMFKCRLLLFSYSDL